MWVLLNSFTQNGTVGLDGLFQLDGGDGVIGSEQKAYNLFEIKTPQIKNIKNLFIVTYLSTVTSTIPAQ